MEVSINKKRHVKLNNFKTTKDLGVLINGEFNLQQLKKS